MEKKKNQAIKKKNTNTAQQNKKDKSRYPFKALGKKGLDVM